MSITPLLYRDICYVCYFHLVSYGCSVRSHKTHRSYGRHLLDHLTTDGAGLTAGQVAVVTILQVDAHLLRCVFTSKISSEFAKLVLKIDNFIQFENK